MPISGRTTIGTGVTSRRPYRRLGERLSHPATSAAPRLNQIGNPCAECSTTSAEPLPWSNLTLLKGDAAQAVTMLFSHIEGATALLSRLGER